MKSRSGEALSLSTLIRLAQVSEHCKKERIEEANTVIRPPGESTELLEARKRNVYLGEGLQHGRRRLTESGGEERTVFPTFEQT